MARKRLPDDFRDFLVSLNKNNVKYLLLGGWAVGIYAQPRATADMDVFIAIDDANLDNLLKALSEFGAPTVDKSHFQDSGRIFRMGRSPIRIEIINSASGIVFAECYARRKTVVVDGVDIPLISREDLIKNKQAAGRDKDKADVTILESMPKEA
jgi:predicted nucleotidyltransferase